MREINTAYTALRRIPDKQHVPEGVPYDTSFDQWDWDTDHTRDVLVDPNGAGNFIGVLCLVVVVALVGRLMLGTAGSTFYLTVGALLVILPMMVLALDANSPVARFARSWAEAAPAASAQTPLEGSTANDQHEWGWHDAPPPPATDTDVTDDATDTETSAATVNATTIWNTAGSALFEDAVTQALAALPEAYTRHLGQVHICVRSEPDDETRRTMGLEPGQTLFGLYTGVPLTRQGFIGAPQPETVTLYAGPIWRATGGHPVALREQVRRTLLHELAHHFGIDHDDMPEWVR